MSGMLADNSLTIGVIVAVYGMLSMMPDTGAETPRINMTVSNALPSGRFDRRAGQLLDDARLDQRADHDEQPGKEHQRLPLDTGQVIALLEPGYQNQDAGAQQRDNRGFDMQHGVADEGSEHRYQHGPALDEQCRMTDGLTLI